VKFDGFDVENEPERKRDLEPFGGVRVPATIYEGKIVHGWNPKALAELVGVEWREQERSRRRSSRGSSTWSSPARSGRCARSRASTSG